MVNNGQQKEQKMRKKHTDKTAQERALEYGLVVRKLDNRPNTPYQTDYYANGKRIRRSYKTYEEAVEDYERYQNTLTKAQNVLWTRNLTIEQVADINTALNMLPKGKTLVDAVKTLIDAVTLIPMSKVVEIFKDSKKELSYDYVSTLSLRIDSFLAHFENWDNANADSIREWISSRGSPKTINHYFTLVGEFYRFAYRRRYIDKNPMDMLSALDFPKIKRKPPKYFSVKDVQVILDFIVNKYPKWVSWFAVGLFSGIRHAEINKLTKNNFNFSRKEITLQSDIVKTGDTWLMENLPSNLWSWLDKYPTLNPISKSQFPELTKSIERNTGIKWIHNGLRHSFATYHLSKYRDSAKTSLLLRHRNKDTLWQHYLGGLVSEDIANQYFSIVP
jgi:integrase